MLTSRSLPPQRPRTASPATATNQVTMAEAPAAEPFRLVWDGAPLSFSEVTGLDSPDMRATLHNGHFRGEAFWPWFNRIKSTMMQRMEVTISQYDERGIAVNQWTLQDAWPVLVIAAPGMPVGEQGLATLVIEHHGVVGAPLKD